MNKIVREHYPASKLPEDLREGIGSTEKVTVTVEVEERPDRVMTLDEIFALQKSPRRTVEDIDADMRALREEWAERG